MNKPFPRHGGQLRAVAEQFGLNQRDLLDFSANINPEGPPLSAISAMQDAFSCGECFTQYPDLEQSLLKQALAEYAGVSADEVLVANGFVPVLDATIRALGLRSCLLPVPSFNEYRQVLEQNTVAVTTVVLRPELGFQYFFAGLLDTACEAILLANPQNPTGVLCNRAELIDFVTQAQELGKYVLLDEAFIDYAPGESLASFVLSFSHLVVFRSLTKFFGMPGLRVAYALANRQVRSRIDLYLAPWSVTTLASIAAVAAVGDRSYAQAAMTLNKERSACLRMGLAELGFEVVQSRANFLLFRMEHAFACWHELIAEHSIVLRLCNNYEGLSEGFVRIAVRDEHSTGKLIGSIRVTSAYKSNCLLLK